jgi:hypothetical protein
MSTSLPRKAKAEVPAMTFTPSIRDSRVMMSSPSPSLKYSFSLSPPMLTKGSAAMDGVRSPEALTAAEQADEAAPAAATSASLTSVIDWNRSAGDCMAGYLHGAV